MSRDFFEHLLYITPLSSMHAKVNRTLKSLQISRKNVYINKEMNFTQCTIAKNNLVLWLPRNKSDDFYPELIRKSTWRFLFLGWAWRMTIIFVVWILLYVWIF